MGSSTALRFSMRGKLRRGPRPLDSAIPRPGKLPPLSARDVTGSRKAACQRRVRALPDKAREKVVACAACHGEHGISRKAGVPSLAGLAPPYLVAAMKAYAAGQRKH